MALNLYGVTVSEAHEPRIDVPGTLLVTLRDLAAICGEGEYTTSELTPDRVAQDTDIVTAYARRGPVLPAPLGVSFKHKDAVDRWLELHYVALSNALTFVDNRVVARVHVWGAGAPDERDAGSELATVAADSLRTLRRGAVTTVPLRIEKVAGLVLSAAYLVERDQWKDFSTEVEEQGRRAPNLRFELTGPWPPYDFVQMQLGT
ncbi:MAG: GvpL/GvpF family gas vesicle protein [Gemmatimonadaceae bacterium]|nr:GvpL/GvpF family gas vesicle protein [Gemmatimonadaceae bacterium]